MLMLKSLLLLALALCVSGIPSLPTDQQYYMKGVFSIPYFNISEPIELIYDATNNRQYINYYDGLDITYNFYNQDITYTVSPVKYSMTCTSSQGNGTLVNVLPTDPTSWAYNGTTTINGVTAYSYSQKITQYGRTGYYTFSVDSNGVPVQFYMDGVDYVFGSHPDVYVLDFATYSNDLSSYEDLFNLPTLCNNAEEVPVKESQIAGLFIDLGEEMKQKEGKIQEKFEQYKSQYDKNYETKEEHNTRYTNFKKAHSKIIKHNAKNLSYKLGMNHYADLSDEEFNTFVKPKVARPTDNGAHSVHDNEDTMSIPQTMDWRQKGCVTPVKDQGVCGSCWTFGSTGSLEGTYCANTNKLVSLSEQQLVDCAYLMGSQGCNGGFAASAFQYIMDAGGIALESTYKYLMQNGICKDNTTQFSGVGVSSYVNVTSGSISALQNAVATQGPVAIAIDASVDDFRYYESGVYDNPACQNGPDDLDHEVLAVGYGATSDGQAYWIVKNSWSTNWGMEGFFYLAQANNLCGPATQATYPIPTTN